MVSVSNWHSNRARASAQCGANRHFLVAGLGAREQQIRHVYARNQQDHGNGDQQGGYGGAKLAGSVGFEWRDAGGPASVEIGKDGFETLRDNSHLAACLLQGDRWLQPTDHRHVVRSEAGVPIEIERRPNVDATQGERLIEIGRSHADEGVRFTIQSDRGS